VRLIDKKLFALISFRKDHAESSFLDVYHCRQSDPYWVAAPKVIKTDTSVNISPSPVSTAHNMSHGAKINQYNNAILSELDKLEAKLGIPALSNQIQASRPYGSIEELVTKKVVAQDEFDRIKDHDHDRGCSLSRRSQRRRLHNQTGD
jgi:hypothetical protein